MVSARCAASIAAFSLTLPPASALHPATPPNEEIHLPNFFRGIEAAAG